MKRTRTHRNAERREAGWLLLQLGWERLFGALGANAPYRSVFWLMRHVDRLATFVFRGRLLRLAALVGTAAAVFAAAVLITRIPPNHRRLREHLDRLRIPAGHEIGSSERGNLLCLGGCPEVSRTLLVPGSLSEWTGRLDEVVRQPGSPSAPWEHDGSPETYATVQTYGFHHNLRLTLRTGAAMVGERVAPVREGHVLIDLRATGTRDPAGRP